VRKPVKNTDKYCTIWQILADIGRYWHSRSAEIAPKMVFLPISLLFLHAYKLVRHQYAAASMLQLMIEIWLRKNVEIVKKC
jgi:hypothetical protein